jgi:AcrR family transcriptional regulator
MSDSDALFPAPGRGQYDRRLPRERRISEQRERLLTATVLAVAHEASPSVASIVRRAGVGRNTFYEYFDDVVHACRAAEAAVLRRLEQVIVDAERTARTPVERWRALARAWLSFADEEPSAMMLVLSIDARARRAMSSGAELLEAALERSLETLRSAGVTAPPAGPERVRAVTAAGETFARTLGLAQIPLDSQDSERARSPAEGWEREQLERAFVDVAVRLLR